MRGLPGCLVIGGAAARSVVWLRAGTVQLASPCS